MIPGIGSSILAMAVGGILRFAVTPTGAQHGFNIHTAGVVLMVVGVLGLILCVALGAGGSPFGRGRIRGPR